MKSQALNPSSWTASSQLTFNIYSATRAFHSRNMLYQVSRGASRSLWASCSATIAPRGGGGNTLKTTLDVSMELSLSLSCLCRVAHRKETETSPEDNGETASSRRNPPGDRIDDEKTTGNITIDAWIREDDMMSLLRRDTRYRGNEFRPYEAFK